MRFLLVFDEFFINLQTKVMHFRNCRYENIQYSGYLSPKQTLYGGHHRTLGNHPQDG